MLSLFENWPRLPFRDKPIGERQRWGPSRPDVTSRGEAFQPGTLKGEGRSVQNMSPKYMKWQQQQRMFNSRWPKSSGVCTIVCVPSFNNQGIYFTFTSVTANNHLLVSNETKEQNYNSSVVYNTLSLTKPHLRYVCTHNAAH